jgi:hypothetical protein
MKSRIAALLLLLTVFPAAAVAQLPIDVDFGVRSGVINEAVPLEVPNNHYFPDVYTTDQPQFPLAAGPAVGVLINNHWYLRFEAVRSPFKFNFVQGTNEFFPYSGQPAITSVTVGHTWQYPLLLTYMVGNGPLRPFAGGGASLGSTFRGTTQTTTTTLVGPRPAGGTPGPFPTMTTISTAPFDTRYTFAPSAFYISGGLDYRRSVFSIRPELRYAHWTGFNNTSITYQDDSILYSPNQMELLLTVSVHPFGKRERNR